MSDREHFIATLQACYFGDRNAFDEIVRIYDKKENIIKEVREEVRILESNCDISNYHAQKLYQILDKEVN